MYGLHERRWSLELILLTAQPTTFVFTVTSEGVDEQAIGGLGLAVTSSGSFLGS